MSTKKNTSKKDKKPRAPRNAKKAADVTARTPRADTKTAGAIALLSTGKGATVAELQEFMGWNKTASVHGFLSGTLRKKMGLNLVADKGDGGVNRYRIKTAA